MEIPYKGKSHDEVLRMLDEISEGDPLYKEGRTWSLVYYLNKEHTDFLEKAYSKFFSANGLNPTVFKSLKRLEKDILRFTADLLNINYDAYGMLTSGGTESCLLAVKTYRDFGRSRGIRKPEMILPETAHVAWEKGAEYFGVKIIKASLGQGYEVSVDDVSSKISKNTIMILGSAPEYPHGIIDPIERLGEIALEKNIPLHVDACVGGYILPFIEANDIKLPLWDFRVPGVTSISADIHKYGFAAKGASCILYRDIEYFKNQIFVSQDWPGGVFASPGLLGTRPGGAYAAAWASIQSLGVYGYLELTRKTLDTVQRLKNGISSIEGLEIIGDPKTSLFAYRSIDPNINIYAVGDIMEEKGWVIDRLQRPDALHSMVTALHDKVAEKYIVDLKDSVKIVLENPELSEKGQAATYGMISHIPLRNMVRNKIINMFANSYKINSGRLTCQIMKSFLQILM